MSMCIEKVRKKNDVLNATEGRETKIFFNATESLCVYTLC